MSLSCRPLLTLFLALMCHFCLAQFESSNLISFNHYNTQHGLSQASVNCILQDSKGFLWFGTDDGLNRFDGTRFKIFRHIQGDSSSIMGNNIQALVEDNEGNIWIGTSEGLSKFDKRLEKFTLFFLPGFEYYTCTDIKFDKERNRIWLASGLIGIVFLDITTSQLQIYQHERLKDVNVLKIEKVNDKLYAGTQEHGLITIQLSNNEVEEIKFSGAHSPSVLKNPVRSILSEDSVLWVGTEGAGLFQYNLKTMEAKSFTQASGMISDNKVWALARGKDGKLWVGTDGGGITLLDQNLKKIGFYKHSDYKPRSVSSNTVRALLVDQNNDIWIGTFNGGVSHYSNFNINFLSFQRDPLDIQSLSHDAVLTFAEHPNGTIYIGTDGGGLNYFKDGIFQRYQFPSYIDNPSVVLSVKVTSKGEILLGTYQDGFYRIDQNKKVTQYKNDSEDKRTISSNIVWDLAEDSKGNIWLATEMGINKLNPHTGEFTHLENMKPQDPANVFTGDFIQSLLIDKDILWGGLYGMLLVYDMNSDSVRTILSTDGTYAGVPNKQILSICKDPTNENVVWFSGRGEALVRYDLKLDSITPITEEQGLPNSLVYALRCDNDGIVWMTTNKGLVRYDHSKTEFFTFGSDFGINVEPFNDNAAFKTSKGYLLFGGANGFTAFLPATPDLGMREFAISITGFQLFNEEVKIDGNLLSRSIIEEDQIELPHDKAKLISFNFSALQFMAPSGIHYQYKLEGFDTTWYEAENRTVSFINLQPRNYTLKVRAGYGAGIWGDEKALSLKIIPPWWMTWYARIGAVLALLFLGYVILRFRTYNLKKRKIQLEKIVAEQNKEIRGKNVELETQNRELLNHNQELKSQRETIRIQNEMLSEAKSQLQQVNQSLESQVLQRTQKLNDTISVLNKTIKELDAFLYSASHDLVAPLKSVLGLVNLARAEDADGTLSSYFDHIEKTIKKLEGVIHTLMQHSYNAKASNSQHVADLRGLVMEAIAEQQFMPEANQIEFNIDFDQAVITTDIPRMKIILSNLIGNAIKYHDPDKEPKLVNIRFQQNERSWMLIIFDNGIGIEQSRMDRIFDMFYRATESAKGSGLGLYIVKETVGKLGGEIRVESESRKWTKFILQFPLRQHALAE